MKKFLIPGLILALALVLTVSVGLAESAEASGIDMTKKLPVGDSLLVMVVGMVIVFLGLSILILLIKCLIGITDGMGKRKKKEPAAQTAKAPVQAPAAEAEEIAADDSLVAAITAALVCAMGGENQGFVVRRIRRV